MIDVPMAQHHRADLVGGKGKIASVSLFIPAASLDQSTIQQYGVAVASQDVTGACYAGGRPVKLDMHD